jgi:hypothetical protein
LRSSAVARSESLGSLGSSLVGGECDVDGRGGQLFRGEGVAAVDVQNQEVAHLVAGLDGDGVLARRVRIGGDEAGVAEDRRGDGLGEHRLWQAPLSSRW